MEEGVNRRERYSRLVNRFRVDHIARLLLQACTGMCFVPVLFFRQDGNREIADHRQRKGRLEWTSRPVSTPANSFQRHYSGGMARTCDIPQPEMSTMPGSAYVIESLRALSFSHAFSSCIESLILYYFDQLFTLFGPREARWTSIFNRSSSARSFFAFVTRD